MAGRDQDKEKPETVRPEINIHTQHNTGTIVGENRGVITAGSVVRRTLEPPSGTSSIGSQVLRILFLGANPKSGGNLHLEQEVRDIDAALRQAEFRDHFDLRQQLAVRPMDLQAALLRHNPHIVHFSGHGDSESIYLEDDSGFLKPVQGAVLARILGAFKKQIRCVVLSACSSKEQSEMLAKDIDFVVGMSSSIKTSSCRRFSFGFYQALAYGSTVQMAFDLGCAQIDLDGLHQQGDTPQLIALRHNPDEVSFVDAQSNGG
jgi:hypothetical protein